MKFGEITLLFCITLFIYSCVTFHSVPLSPKQAADSFEARRLDDQNLRKFLETNLHHKLEKWPPKSWDFTMLTLVAYYYHPDLDVARARWEEAQTKITAAGERPNPSIGIFPGYNTSASRIGGVSPWFSTYSFDIPIETAGKRGHRVEQATYNSKTAYLNIITVSWQVRSRLRTRMLNLYNTIQAQNILNRQLAIEEENVKLLEGRLPDGVSPAILTQAHISLNKTLLALREMQKQNREAYVGVADAIGLPSSALAGAELGIDIFDSLLLPINLEEARQYALLNRPDILGALAEYDASQAALQLEIAKQYPDIHLGPGYSYDFDGNKWNLGISLTLPIFNQNKGTILEAEARRKESMALFNLKQSSAIGEIDRAIAGYRAARVKLETSDSLLATQKKYQQLIQSTTGQGEVHRVATLNAELELASAELARLDALVEAQQSFGLLEDAIRYPIGLPKKK